VTWKPGASQHTLKSEKEVLDAAEDNLVTIEKTRIVLNCPVLYTDTGDFGILVWPSLGS